MRLVVHKLSDDLLRLDALDHLCNGGPPSVAQTAATAARTTTELRRRLRWRRRRRHNGGGTREGRGESLVEIAAARAAKLRAAHTKWRHAHRRTLRDSRAWRVVAGIRVLVRASAQLMRLRMPIGRSRSGLKRRQVRRWRRRRSPRDSSADEILINMVVINIVRMRVWWRWRRRPRGAVDEGGGDALWHAARLHGRHTRKVGLKSRVDAGSRVVLLTADTAG